MFIFVVVFPIKLCFSHLQLIFVLNPYELSGKKKHNPIFFVTFIISLVGVTGLRNCSCSYNCKSSRIARSWKSLAFIPSCIYWSSIFCQNCQIFVSIKETRTKDWRICLHRCLLVDFCLQRLVFQPRVFISTDDRRHKAKQIKLLCLIKNFILVDLVGAHVDA